MRPAGDGHPGSRGLVTPSDASCRVLVVGLGSPDRGDDAAGPLVAAAIARTAADRALVGVHVVEREDPTALVDLLDPATPADAWAAAVIIDAVRSGAAPGTVTILDVGPGAHDLRSLGARLDPGPAGTHGFGLAGAIELARALDRLPPQVVVVGIEAVGFEHGAPLSAPVRAAIPAAADAALGRIEEATARIRPGARG
jgi:hydrogenase maturation protease